MINEVAPPGWGHTKAEKEKTKPNKPKSKIGGTAHAMQKAQKRGDIPKNMNIFALMWSMKNKGDKPHYKPGVKGKLKGKYKGPEGQNEMIDPKKIRNYKNVPNSVVAKADKEAEKVKDKEQKGTLEFPQMPTEESTWSKNFKKQGAKRRGETRRRQQAQQHSPGQRVPPKTKNYGEDMSLAPKGKGKKAAKALYKEWGDTSILSQLQSRIAGRPDISKKKQKLSITPAGKKALKKGDHKLSITAKGRAAVKEITGGIPVSKKMAGTTVPPKQAPRSQRMDKSKNLMPAPGWKTRKAGNKPGEMSLGSYDPTLTHFGDVLRQAIAEAKKVSAIDTINKIVKTKTMGKIHNQKVDLFTASAIQQVYNAINQKNKEKMNSVMSKDVHGLLKMADFSMSKMKR